MKMDTHTPGLAATSQEEPRSSCLLIKVDKLQLIVPRILVAEVVDLEGISFTSSLNKDIKMFAWRDYQVPLVSANLLDAECTTQIHRHSKVIVFHAVVNRDKLPFYAFIASTNPRLVVVSAASIEEQVTAENQSLESDAVLMPVMVEGEMAAIPRVQQIEKLIHDSLPGRG
jgi:hypothetical protein